jgi:ribosomal protein L13E
VASLTLDTKGWVRGLANLQANAPAAIARALNRSVTSANVVMVRAVATDLALRQSDVKERISVRNASPAHLVAQLIATGKRIPLIKFNARERRGRGVTARLPGGQGSYPRAFIATMSSGHRGVFVRKGKPRLPIAELFGPSIPHVFQKHIPQGLARGLEQLAKNLVSEMRFALRRSAG